jgi:hypothetical protein
MAVIALAIAACGGAGGLDPVDPEDRVVAGMLVMSRISGEPLPAEFLEQVIGVRDVVGSRATVSAHDVA